MNTDKAVKLAFPKLKPQTRQIIADWYDNEDASDDFDNLRDYAEHIKFDLMDMIWAATHATEVKAVKDDLVACGYYNADQFPEDEESEDVAVPDPEDDEKKAIRIAKREGLTPKQIELFVQMRRAWANIKESTKITLTFAQLKRLVKESKAWPTEIEYDDEEFDVIDEPKKPRKSRKQQQAPVEDRILDLLQAIEDAGYRIVSPYSGVPGRRLYNVLGGGEDTKEKEFNELKDLVEQNGLTDIVRLRPSRSTSNAFYKYGKTDTNAFSLSWENTYKVGLKDLNTRNSDRKSSRLHMTSRYKDAHGKSGAAKSRHWQRQLGLLD